jgi:pullulanase/glycogen debranching enzyme
MFLLLPNLLPIFSKIWSQDICSVLLQIVAYISDILSNAIYCRWAEWNGKYRDDIRRFIKVLCAKITC